MYEKNEDANVLMGVDLSTTVLGVTLLDIDTKKIIDITYHTFEKGPLLEKAVQLKGIMNEYISSFKIKHFCIEERLKSFQAGQSNMESLGKLMAFNFYCQTIFHNSKITIHEISVSTARKLVLNGFHTIARSLKTLKGQKQKEVAFEWVVKILGEDMFPKKVMKSGKKKGQSVFIDEARDMADSWIVASAGLILISTP
jgi:hypothetical protein